MHGKIKREPKDFLNQITTYADAITAFSVLQAVAFTLAVASAEKFVKTIQIYHASVLTILGCAVLLYWLLLFWCHRTEDKIAQKPEEANVANALRVIRTSRYFFTFVASGLCFAMAWSPQ